VCRRLALSPPFPRLNVAGSLTCPVQRVPPRTHWPGAAPLRQALAAHLSHITPAWLAERSTNMPKPPIELDAVDDIDPEALDLSDETARNDDPPWSEDDDEHTIPDDLDDDGEED